MYMYVNVGMMYILPLVLILSSVASLIAFPFDEFNAFDYGASGSGQTDDSQVRFIVN